MVALGHYLGKLDLLEVQSMIVQANQENPWFTHQYITLALNSFKQEFLNEEKLTPWLSQYDEIRDRKKIGLILAGNIPAVGWYDVLCTFLSGHTSVIKFSEKDKVIIPFLLSKLCELCPSASAYFEIIERLTEYDAVIATGSDNTSRYFKSYFGHRPHIIRQNRNGIGVLNGSENEEDFILLGQDIFTYFGLGCRNISKVYVPRNYNFEPFLETTHNYFKEIIHHHKYKNNYDYNIALFLLNKVKYQNNGCLILLEDSRFTSRIASLHYEYYDDEETLQSHLLKNRNLIQCIVSKNPLNDFEWFDFGKAQSPGLTNYADGIDTMKFLSLI
jgi:hypothetical protein